MQDREWKEHLGHWIDYLNARRSDLNQRQVETEDPALGRSVWMELIKVERQIKALQQVQYAAVRNPRLLFDFIQPSVPARENKLINGLQYVLDLNDSQKHAVALALNESDLCLIQGPPGTGKTQVIAEICLQLYRRNPKVKILVCAETHVAVNNLMNRIGKYEKEIRMVRIHDKGEDEQLQKYLPASIINDYLEWLEHSCDDTDLKRAISESMSNPFDLTLEKSLALSANVTGMTCNRLGAYYFEGDTEYFDVVIIDEVCKATLPEILMPLTVADKAILVGDPKQLPPVFCSEETEVIKRLEHYDLQKHFYINDLFDTHDHVFLDTQYRMVAEIGTMVSWLFYCKSIKNGRNETVNNSIVWIDYLPRHNWPIQPDLREDKPVLRNDDELEIILALLRKLDRTKANGTITGIITPYRHQKEAIKERLEQYSALKVEVDTVDGFQGRECDIVVFSVTRTTGPYRFLADDRRLNVAISRARDQIYMIGTKDYAERQPLLNHILGKSAIEFYSKTEC